MLLAHAWPIEPANAPASIASEAHRALYTRQLQMSLAVGNHEGNRTGALGALITMAAFGTHPERARTALQRCKNQVLRQPYRAFDDFRKRPARRIETTAVPANRAPIVASGSTRRTAVCEELFIRIEPSRQDRVQGSSNGARML